MDVSILVGVFLFYNCFVICVQASRLKLSRVVSTWRESRDGCQEFGGHLATLKNLDHFRYLMENNMSDIVMEDSKELWVGGVLVDVGWQWEGQGSGDYSNGAMKNLIIDRGCYKQAFWLGGEVLPGVNAETCFNRCHWKGAVGLKKDFCICEKDLRNVTVVDSDLCNFVCTGNLAENCGGLFAVSIYQTTVRTISWAADEPKPHNDCVYIRRKSPGSRVEWVSSSCDLQTRFLCRFENDDKCGVRHSCIRWSTQHGTWEKAKKKCEEINGSLAEITNAHALSDLENLPPGTFWIALRRRRLWRWDDGTTIPSLNFYGHERQINPVEACAVIHNIKGNYGFSARSCLLKRNYLCQYDYMRNPSDKRSDMQPQADSGKIMSESATTSLPKWYPKNNTKSNGFVSTATETRQGDFTKSGVLVRNIDKKDKEPEAEPSSVFEDSGLLNTCMYVVIGFVSGMGFILLAGLFVYLCLRFFHRKETDKKGAGQKRGPVRVCYSSDQESVKVTNGQDSDGIYDTVYDLQTESPFRRTQRLIRMGSATKFRHAQPRRPHSDNSDSPDSVSKYGHAQAQRQRSDVSDVTDYTWRGEIGGKIEVINTELRHGLPQQPSRYDDVSYVVHNQARCKPVLKHPLQFPKHPHSTAKHGLEDESSDYEFATSEAFGFDRGTNSGAAHRQSQYEENSYPTFVEMEAKLSELANEENLYASIKKTFPKHKDKQGGKQTTNLDSSDDDV